LTPAGAIQVVVPADAPDNVYLFTIRILVVLLVQLNPPPEIQTDVEHSVLEPFLYPEQVQDHGPVPVTSEGVPLAHKPVDGKTDDPIAFPHLPLLFLYFTMTIPDPPLLALPADGLAGAL
jgi:hypothetical protein